MATFKIDWDLSVRLHFYRPNFLQVTDLQAEPPVNTTNLPQRKVVYQTGRKALKSSPQLILKNNSFETISYLWTFLILNIIVLLPEASPSDLEANSSEGLPPYSNASRLSTLS